MEILSLVGSREFFSEILQLKLKQVNAFFLSGHRAMRSETEDESPRQAINLSNFGEFRGSISRIDGDHIKGSFVAKMPEGTPHSYLKSLVGVKVDGGARRGSENRDSPRSRGGSASYMHMGSHGRANSSHASANANRSGPIHVSYASPSEVEDSSHNRFNRRASGPYANWPPPPPQLRRDSRRQSRNNSNSGLPTSLDSPRDSCNDNNNTSQLHRLEQRVSVADDHWGSSCLEQKEDVRILMEQPRYSNLARRMQAFPDERPSRENVHSFDSFL